MIAFLLQRVARNKGVENVRGGYQSDFEMLFDVRGGRNLRLVVLPWSVVSTQVYQVICVELSDSRVRCCSMFPGGICIQRYSGFSPRDAVASGRKV